MSALSCDVVLKGVPVDRSEEILTTQALNFLRALDNEFSGARADLLRARRERDLTKGLDFLPDTEHIRGDYTWRVAEAAPGLLDRRVEITGPVDRKMTINALNSGAKVWLADFEDATSPSWTNVIEGQVNLKDAIRREISFENEAAKRYELNEGELATIVVRPRGWHLSEKNIIISGRSVSAGLVDFGLYFFHNARTLIESGVGPYFYLPKIESHLEARLWNDVFIFAQEYLRIARGTIRATVLIETITAAFCMEEILYELREHAAGLNAGRWDYIFSVIKNFGTDPEFVLPDRADVLMTVPFMRSYTELLVKTCHKRGAHAIGGMAAVIPSKDTQANAVALEKVKADKEREAGDGYDGSWVAHPGLVETCRAAFTEVFGDAPHQKDRQRDDVNVSAPDLLAVSKTPGAVTSTGVRANVSVALRYIDAWLDGRGAVGLNGLMEDAATAEISRCQLWQWIHHGVRTADDNTVITACGVASIMESELSNIAAERGAGSDNRVRALREIFSHITLEPGLPRFFTTEAYSNFLNRSASSH